VVSEGHSDHLSLISNFQMPSIETYLEEAVNELTEFKERV
jgi:hypothetical protein